MNLERYNGFFYAETSKKVPLSSQFDENYVYHLPGQLHSNPVSDRTITWNKYPWDNYRGDNYPLPSDYNPCGTFTPVAHLPRSHI